MLIELTDEEGNGLCTFDSPEQPRGGDRIVFEGSVYEISAGVRVPVTFYVHRGVVTNICMIAFKVS